MKTMRTVAGNAVLVVGVLATVLVSLAMFFGPVAAAWNEPMGSWTVGGLVMCGGSMMLSIPVGWVGVFISRMADELIAG